MSTISVLCYNCGVMYERSYDTASKSLLCRSCLIKQAIAQTAKENKDLLDRLID